MHPHCFYQALRNWFKRCGISAFFLVLAGALNAAMDIVLFHYPKSVFTLLNNPQYFSSHQSWENKWQKIDGQLMYGVERFWQSSAALVFLTDFWHLAKLGMILFLMAAIVSYKYPVSWRVKVLDALIFYVVLTTSFSLFFEDLLRL